VLIMQVSTSANLLLQQKSAVILLIDYELYVMYKNYRCILSDVRTSSPCLL